MRRIQIGWWRMPFVLAFLFLCSMAWPQALQASEEAWRALQEGGTIALFRHARAPGTGDPTNFRLEDCATQRNLSAEGRRQAQAIGEAFRTRRIPVERVLSSRWCRALDTARLAFGALTEPFPPLDSFFEGREQEPARTQAVRRTIQEWRSNGVLVLVTHQVNITALTGIFPAEGEMLVLRPKQDAGFDLVGRIKL
ncbi:histidine phosphatase family protein [Microvirga sp. CF3016]|uniref:histidine phosphatase family protein n=1 Tax=Microvirga sp. CF3016 TaxID=3110181 RepID=UPI002E75A0B9|nr:histidine phosphatase family protein [Microvirga sp. CF3016]MEE1613595.1 histidine phosphatase family protein [Microvirga sp. CF3016]